MLATRNHTVRYSGRLIAVAIGVAAGSCLASEGVNPLRPPDTSSPRATLTSFRENVDASYRLVMALRDTFQAEGGLLASDAALKKAAPAERYFDHAVRCLDLSKVPPGLRDSVGLESTLLLKEILDRIEPPPMDTVPDAAKIAALDLGRHESYRWRIPGTELDIARVTEGPRAGEFLFSPQTVERVVSDHEKVRALPYQPGSSEGFYRFYISTAGRIVPPRWLTWVEHLPRWAKTPYADQTLWQWVGLCLTVLLAFAVVIVIHRRSRQVEPIAPGRRMLRHLLTPVAAAVSAMVAGFFIDEQLNITGSVLTLVKMVETLVTYVMGAWALFIAGTGIADWIIASPRIHPEGLDASLIRLLFRVIAAILAMFLIGYGARELGAPLTAVFASLGVGGLAVGLAARPTIENLIGSFSLYADRPVAVGDFCQYGDRMGTVEEIGLRSTKIRGLDRTVTTIPNEDFAKIQITNFTRRDRMLLQTTLGLRYETTPEQLRFVLGKLRELLLAHPRIMDEPARVRFVGFGDFSLNVEIFAYANTPDRAAFLAIQEDVFLRIMNIVSEAGTGFAFPSQTTYHARDDGLPADRTEAAESQVRAWRVAGALPFPDVPADHRQEIEDTLDYPPVGSPEARRSEDDSSSS
ncbi:MAG: mechanosensitive ion channel family protein [Phycisphaerae bacterium]|nr:mechanosensitive ion channel family protein [Phycisphaerae bacterium]